MLTKRRLLKVVFKCDGCGKDFHPLYNWNQGRKTTGRHFCSFKCYLRSGKRIGIPHKRWGKVFKEVGLL